MLAQKNVCRKTNKNLYVSCLHATDGRVRLSVRGLFDSPQIKSLLEDGLNRHPAITLVKPSEITGCVTVYGDLRESVNGLLTAVNKLIHDELIRVVEGGSLERTRPVSRRVGGDHDENFAEAASIEQGHQTLQKLETTEEGLTRERYTNIRNVWGENIAPKPGVPSSLDIFAEQFKSLPVAVLGGSALLSIATGGLSDAMLIGGVVVTNALLSFQTERTAIRTLSHLDDMADRTVKVLRSGEKQDVRASSLVPGDIVHIRSGSIPADIRVLKESHLTVDESSLTGESEPVKKVSKRIDRPENLADFQNIIFAGTVVTGGSGVGVVVATGAHTQQAKIQELFHSTEDIKTPLQKDLDRIGGHCVRDAGLVCLAVMGIGLIRGMQFASILRISSAAAVAAIPEGLTTVGTIGLSKSVIRMRRRGVMVKKIQSIEALGSIEILALDKTGTLTLNKMHVVAGHLFHLPFSSHLPDEEIDKGVADREEFQFMGKVALLCNLAKRSNATNAEDSSEELNGSPTENALLEFALSSGCSYELREEWPRYHTLHRTEGLPFMATFHRRPDGSTWVAAKGSPEAILDRSSHYMDNGKVKPLQEKDRARLVEQNKKLAVKGLRVLAFAYQQAEQRDELKKKPFIWLGLLGMKDPTRHGMKELLGRYRDAGVKTILLTGDQKVTGEAIGREAGINGSAAMETIESKDFSSLSPQEFQELALRTNIFTRISPSGKYDLIQALKRSNKIVAMIGDGVNDTPALRIANVGIAMGRSGSNSARDAADVVLMDDQIEGLLRGIEEGRCLRVNLKDSISFLLSSNVSELIAIALGMMWAPEGLFNSKQLLWINLVTDIFPALGFISEGPESDLMQRSPKTFKAEMFSKDDWQRMAFDAMLMAIPSLGTYGVLRKMGTTHGKASTGAFLGVAAGQMLYVYKKSHSTVKENPYLFSSAIGGLALAGLGVYLPILRRILGMESLNLKELLVPLALTGVEASIVKNRRSMSQRKRSYNYNLTYQGLA